MIFVLRDLSKGDAQLITHKYTQLRVFLTNF